VESSGHPSLAIELLPIGNIYLIREGMLPFGINSLLLPIKQ